MIHKDEIVLGAKLLWSSRDDSFIGVIVLLDRQNNEVGVNWTQAKTGVGADSHYYSVRSLCNYSVRTLCNLNCVSRVYESLKDKVLSDYL